MTILLLWHTCRPRANAAYRAYMSQSFALDAACTDTLGVCVWSLSEISHSARGAAWEHRYSTPLQKPTRPGRHGPTHFHYKQHSGRQQLQRHLEQQPLQVSRSEQPPPRLQEQRWHSLKEWCEVPAVPESFEDEARLLWRTRLPGAGVDAHQRLARRPVLHVTLRIAHTERTRMVLIACCCSRGESGCSD